MRAALILSLPRLASGRKGAGEVISYGAPIVAL